MNVSAAAAPKVFRTFIDGDGHRIERHSNPDKLGQLVDQALLGKPPEDLKIMHKSYVVMASNAVPTDLLTIPTAPVSGIEAPEASRAGAENYFADAWKDGREQAALARGTTVDQLPRDAVALAVNSQNARSQDRLHIHADLLEPELADQLKAQVAHGDVNSGQWTDLQPVYGHQYRATWVPGKDLTQNPFQMIREEMVHEHGEEYARTHMGMHTVAVVGETNSQGQQGFVVIDGVAGQGDSGSAEEWLIGHRNSVR